MLSTLLSLIHAVHALSFPTSLFQPNYLMQIWQPRLHALNIPVKSQSKMCKSPASLLLHIIWNIQADPFGWWGKLYIIHKRDLLRKEKICRGQFELFTQRDVQQYWAKRVSSNLLFYHHCIVTLFPTHSITLTPPAQFAPPTYSCTNIQVVGNDAGIFSC